MATVTLRYVCPKHSDVVLFEEIMRTDIVEMKVFSLEKPKECKKCGISYTKSECTLKGGGEDES